MKIVLLATIYEYGGVSSFIKNLLDNLDRKKFEVVFLVERLALKHYPLRKDTKFINLDIKPTRPGVQKLVNILRHLHRIRKTVICENPDVVLSFGFSISCLCLLAFLWPLKNMPKIVLSEHTEQLFVRRKLSNFKESFFSFFYRTIMYLLYWRADAIVPVSNSLAKHIRKFLLIDNKKIKVIHVPLNIERIRILSQEKICDSYKNANGSFCIGTVSRLSAEKGISYLLEAFCDLVKRINANLIIIGDGDQRSNLEEMGKNLKIEERVSFLGWLENPYNYLKKMDVFVLSSLWEGFPSVILESMVCGIPVVATRSVGGVEEIIKDGVNGLLVSPGDIRALSDSIYRLLQDEELKNKFIKEAGKQIERFDSRKITREYESLMSNIFR